MKKVIEQLNQIQADAHVLFVAFHDYHWNVKGMEFYQVHAFTEKAYENMATLFDDMAERALQLGGKAVVKVDELTKLAKAPTISKASYKGEEVLKAVLKADEYLIAEFKKLESEAEKAGDATTVAIAQGEYAKLEKEVWMLENSLAK